MRRLDPCRVMQEQCCECKESKRESSTLTIVRQQDMVGGDGMIKPVSRPICIDEKVGLAQEASQQCVEITRSNNGETSCPIIDAPNPTPTHCRLALVVDLARRTLR